MSNFPNSVFNNSLHKNLNYLMEVDVAFFLVLTLIEIVFNSY